MTTKPNFLVVGAAKCGTTSLYYYLKNHPEIFMPEVKEINLFVDQAKTPITIEAYESLFSNVENERAIGDVSTGYLYDPSIPEKMANYLGIATKIVIILRNPVDMAYSLWGQKVRDGGEHLPFMEAIKVEKQRLHDKKFRNNCIGWIYNYCYLSRAKYYLQVKRFIDVFGQKNVRVLIYENFFNNFYETFPKLCEFIGVSTNYFPQFEKHNIGRMPRWWFLQNMLNRQMFWKEPLKLIIPKHVRQILKHQFCEFNMSQKTFPQLSESEKNQLMVLLADDINKLELLIEQPIQEIWRGIKSDT